MKQLLIVLFIGVICAHSSLAVAQSSQITSARLGGAATWTPQRVEVFVSGELSVPAPPGATVYRVDGAHQIAAQLSAGGLPADPQKALVIVQARLKGLQASADLKQHVQTALNAADRQHRYGIQQLPAVVLDERWVLEGSADVALATQKVRQGLARQVRPWWGDQP